MELNLETIRALIMMAKDADLRAFRLGDLEFAFDAPPDDSEETVGFIPNAGKVLSPAPNGELEEAESSTPPAYRALFPNGAPRFRRPRSE